MPRPLHVALIPLGSHGDVHPLVGLGVRLRQRGHDVTVLTNGYFEPLCRQAGLGFWAHSSADDYIRLTGDPELWHPRRGFKAIARALMEPVPATYNELIRLHQLHGDRLVVVASSLGLSGRLAQESIGLNLATVHLSPTLFQSLLATPRYPGVPPMHRTPRWVKRGFYLLMNRLVDKLVGPGLNAFRHEIGLRTPAKGLFKDWWNSPQLVLAMFPDWFAPPQADWPPNTHAVGFPLYDERDLTALPPELETFLQAGPSPVAFTPGSAMFHGQRFFRTAADACRLGGLRGVLLSRHADHIPAPLPPGVIHIPFAPFSRLLPHCAAIVHHGGIGTLSQGLAAGVPQVIHPFAHDQPDNADRVERLNVGRMISGRRFTAKRLARTLQELIGSPQVKTATDDVAKKLASDDAVAKAVSLIESLAR